MIRRISWALGLLLALLAVALAAQSPAFNFAPGMRWRLIGPFRGGRVLAVSGVPGKPNLFYFGAVGGGVWRTTNAGQVWRPIFDRAPIASIGAIAVAPSDPNVIYVGTGEADMRSDISFGDGIYQSTDAGKTWRHIGLSATRHIGRIVVDPHNPDLVLVAALGRAYGPNSERGIFRSADGGASWQKVLYKDDNTGGIDLSFDPANPRIVFAVLWNARRPAWNQYPPNQGPGSGLYRSTDEGLTWAPVVGDGLPAAQWGRAGVAVAYGDGGQRVFALIDVTGNSAETGLYRSDDGGGHWNRVSTDPRLVSRAWYFSGIYPDPQNLNVVYVANVALYRSIDGGHSFTAIKGAPGGDDYHALWLDPSDSRRMILGVDQGVAISVDDGATWSSWYNQPTAQIYHVATDNRWPYWVYGAQQDSGTVAIVSRGDYGQITFRDWHSVAGGESGYVVPDPLDPNIVYAGSYGGTVTRYNNITGQAQDISPWSGADKYRYTWTFPIAISPQDPHLLYVGAQMLLATHDDGMSWQAISPDLTHYEASEAQPADPVAGRLYVEGKNRGVVYTIAPSPARAGEIWIGTDDGLIWLTPDGGKTWNNVTPKGLPAWSKISLIDAAQDDAGTAYAAVDRHRVDDFKPYIYRTHDYGRSWQLAAAGIPDDAYVHVVRADPQRKGLLFAGTELGVYVSFNDGDAWQPLQLNLPNASIRDLAIHDNDLIAATHGRAFWILDDITPLRQMTAAVAASAAYLFAPETAIRVRANENNDTPLPPETPMGHNPPDGAVLDYYLSSAPTSPISLEILDARGRQVRHFTSTETISYPIHEPLPVATYWLTPPRSLPDAAGLNRFVWNLRYPLPAALDFDQCICATPHQTFPTPEGPLVLPGRYTVRLTVNGQTYTQPLTVTMDPRVHVAATDLQRQLTLEMQIGGDLTASRDADEAIANLRAQLAAWQKRWEGQPQAAAALAAARALDAQAAGITGQVADLFGSGAVGAGLANINAELATLATVVASADAAPTAQAADAFQQLHGQLAAVMAQWHGLASTGLSHLNDLIRRSGLPAIRIETP